jgi:glutathione S-transferase
MTSPKITLYTAYTCPWAQRAQIALRELNIDFETVIVDLTVPRTPEYLAVNPRGLVPTLVYDGEIIAESAIVSQFLADSHPSHLLKTSSEPGGALQRAKINYFVDTYFTKVNSLYFAAVRAKKGEDKDAAAEAFANAVIKEIEPLLKDAKPFFGGASKLTLAEVSCCNLLAKRWFFISLALSLY